MVVAEQYRGTFVQENNTSRYLTITENRLIESFSDDDVGQLAHTEGSKLYYSEGNSLCGTFTDNNTLVWNDPSLPTKFFRKPE